MHGRLCLPTVLTIWVTGSNSGTRYNTLGSTASVQLSTAPTNVRQVNIFNGHIYVTSGSSPFSGVSVVGTGLTHNKRANQYRIDWLSYKGSLSFWLFNKTPPWRMWFTLQTTDQLQLVVESKSGHWVRGPGV